MSTHATAALAHGSPGGVAPGNRVHGKPIQQGEHGKTGSAGFAQILGEQVAKGTVKIAEKASEESVPHAVEQTSPHAVEQTSPHTAPQSLPRSTSHSTPESLSQSLPHAAPQLTKAAAEKAVPRAFAQIRYERSQTTSPPTLPPTLPPTSHALAHEPKHAADGEHRSTGTAQLAHTEKSAQPVAARLPVRLASPQPGPTSPTEAAETSGPAHVPASHVDTPASVPMPEASGSGRTFSNKVQLPSQASATAIASNHTRSSAAVPTSVPTSVPFRDQIRPHSSAANHDQAESAPNPSPRAEAHRASVPSRTSDSSAHAQSTANKHTSRAPVEAHEHTTPAASQAGESTVQLSAKIAIATAHTRSTASENTPRRSNDTNESTSETAAHAQPEPSVNTPRVSLEAREHTASFQASEPAVRLQTEINGTTAHGRSPATKNTPRLSDDTNETTTPVPSTVGETVVQPPAQTSNSAAHVNHPADAQTPRVSTKANESTVPVPFKTGEFTTRVPSPSSQASSPTPASPPTPTSPPTPASPSTDAPKHAATPSHAHQVRATADNASPLPSSASIPDSQESSAQKTSSSLDAPAPRSAHVSARPPLSPPTPVSTDGTRVVDEPPARENPRPTSAGASRAPAPESHPSDPTVLVTEPHARVPEQSDSLPSPAHFDHHDVASASTAHQQKPQTKPGHAQANPTPPSASPAIPQPSSAAKPQHTAQPTAEPPSVPTETPPTQSPADVKTRGPDTNHIVTIDENAEHATTEKAVSTDPKHGPTSPTPPPNQLGNKATVQLDPKVGKRPTRVATENDSYEADSSPAKTSQANPLPPPTRPGAPVELKTPKQEVSQSSERQSIADGSSQTSTVPSQAGQPQATKPDLHQATVVPTERSTIFAPQSAFLPSNLEAAISDVSTPSPIAAERVALVDRAIDDPGLAVTVMPHSAHVSIAGDTGDLALHVRIRDGNADVNVSGTMAPLFDAKAPEVRTVLAGEGLQLGSFATDQQGHSQGRQGQPESAPRATDMHPLPSPRRSTPSIPEVQIADDRRIHVTA